ncbi:MAG TPA: SUMF1/EgtB/PvdO family nonheme iron enzyme, partial [Pyrinomonadaceae bacterium]
MLKRMLTNGVCRLLLALSCALALAGTQGCRGEGPGEASPSPGANVRDGMVLVEGGTFRMGADDEMPDESPGHEVRVGSFWMDAREVTVAEFARFVEATGYRTDAERFGWSGVFERGSGDWARVDGADWRHPEGPASHAAPEEPVCQVSWR